MSKKPDCSRCGRPVADNAYLCRACGDVLDKLLGNIPAIVDEWTVTYIRQSKSEKLAGHVTSTAVPWNDDASKAMAGLRATLVTWAMLIHDEAHNTRAKTLPVAGERHGDGEASVIVSRWLLHHVEWLRHHGAGGECVEDILGAVREINHVMDNLAERRYAGPCMAEYHHGDCGCQCHRGRYVNVDCCFDIHVAEDGQELDLDACCLVELYAKPDADVIVCRSCKTPHNVEARRAWLLEQAQDQLMQAEHIGRALASLGKAVTPDMIRGYAARKRITPHGWIVRVADDGEKRIPLYRVGDVIAVVHQIAVETERKHVARDAKNARKSVQVAS